MNNSISPNQDQSWSKSKLKSIIIYGGPLIDGRGSVFDDGAIYITSGKVAAVGNEEAVFNQIASEDHPEAYDTFGRLIAPGLINLHQHSCYSLAVGLPEFDHCNQDWHTKKSYWLDFSQHLDAESIQLSLLLSIMHSIRAGVTTTFELHSSPLEIGSVLKNMASVIEQSGVRFALSSEAAATNGTTKFIQSIEQNHAFLQQYRDNQLIRGMFGLQVNKSLTEKLLGLIAEKIGSQPGIHIHLGGIAAIEHCQKLGYPGPISRLNEFDLINKKALLVSCVSPSSTELELIIQKGATLVNVPPALVPNQPKLPSLPIPAKLRQGIGTAGYHQDILHTLRQVYLIYRQQGFSHDTIMKYIETLLLTNRTFAGLCFAGKPGILERSAMADIVVFNYIPITPINKNNYLDHLLFGMAATSVNMVMVNGKFIYNDWSFLTLDEELILAECKKVSRRLWKAFGKTHPVAFEDDLD